MIFFFNYTINPIRIGFSQTFKVLETLKVWETEELVTAP